MISNTNTTVICLRSKKILSYRQICQLASWNLVVISDVACYLTNDNSFITSLYSAKTILLTLLRKQLGFLVAYFERRIY